MVYKGLGWGYIAGEVVRTMVYMHGTKERKLPKNLFLTILLVFIGTLVNYTGCMSLNSARHNQLHTVKVTQCCRKNRLANIAMI